MLTSKNAVKKSANPQNANFFFSVLRHKKRRGSMEKIYLILENGAVFEGESVGAPGKAIGEVVFTTGVLGYLDTLTDPLYKGQIVVQTFPLIGNYGTNETLDGKQNYLSGYVVRELCDIPSNFHCDGNLKDYLKKQNIVCISGIDTRHLTKILREQGVMNGYISSSPVLLSSELEALKEYKVSQVTQQLGIQEFEKKVENANKNVVVIGNGALGNVVDSLAKKGCNIKVVRYDATASEILSQKPDGVVISNGVGNPYDNENEIEQIKQLMGNIPMLGLGLGHHLMAIAQGGQSIKMKHGRRGSNQPVKDTQSEKVFVMTKNQGYVVDTTQLSEKAKITFVNVNDGLCEGLQYVSKKALSVEFEPNYVDGPQNTDYVYDNFIQLMEDNK